MNTRSTFLSQQMLMALLVASAAPSAFAGPSPDRVDDIGYPLPFWDDGWFRDTNENRIDDDFEGLVTEANQVVDFMVTFKRVDWESNRADLVAGVQSIVTSYSGDVDRDFSILPTLVVLDAEVSSPLWEEYEGYLDPLMRELLNDEELGIVMIEALHQFVPSATDYLVADHVVPQLWDPNNIYAGEQGYLGLVAIVDSGVESFWFDTMKFAGGYDAYTGTVTDPIDVTFGTGSGTAHGTRVSYIASGLGFHPEPLGVAPFAGTIDVSIATAGNDTTTSDIIIAAFDWLYLNKDNVWNIPGLGPPGIDLVGIDAVNVSYSDNGPVAHRFVPGGGSGNCATVSPSNGTDNTSRSADSLVTYGNIPVVVAAGNCGEYMNGFGDLAASAKAITVGAYGMGQASSSTLDDTLFVWSNHGPDPYGKQKPELTAPGDVLGLQGTSFSTPQVTGTVAIMRTMYQTESPGLIKQALIASAVESRQQQGFDPGWGFGILESKAALDSLVSAHGAPPNPGGKRSVGNAQK